MQIWSISAIGLLLSITLCSCSQVGDLWDGQFEWPGEHTPQAAATTQGSADAETRQQALISTAAPKSLAPPPDAPRQVFVGTEEFINRGAAARANNHDSARGDISFDFVDADVREVARSILGDTLKLNYAVDPNVQGVITAQTSSPLPRSEILSTFEDILSLHGISIVKSGELYELVAEADVLQSAMVPRLRARTAQPFEAFGVEIIPLDFIAAKEMANILEPFLPSGSILRVDSNRNMLLVAGTRRIRSSATEIVEIFDVDWFSGTSFALVPLRSSRATAIIEDLEKVFGDQAEGALSGLVRFIPIERTNALLVITSKPAYLEKARAWIDRFDIGSETRERRIFVYRVQNGRASDLADVLGRIFGADRRQAPQLPPGQLAPGLQPVQITSAKPSPFARRHIEARSSQNSESADPETAAPELPQKSETPPIHSRATGRGMDRPADRKGIGFVEDGDIRIIADEVNNSLVILATPAEYRQVENAIRQLDVMPLQVLIEATIAEVTLNRALRFGIQWFLRAGDSSLTLSRFAKGVVAPQFPGFAYVLSASDADVVIDALDRITDVKVVSSPKLMVLDNRTAELQVGDQVPIATQSAVSVISPDAPQVNTIEFRDTGVVLTVTPLVNAGGLVTLEIEQEVSDAVPTTTSALDSPTIQQRRISSSVAVQSGETIALGGLIRDQQNREREGLPVLSSIPVLGHLFGSTEKLNQRTELLVLITPRVIRDPDEARSVTEELRERVHVFTSDKEGSE